MIRKARIEDAQHIFRSSTENLDSTFTLETIKEYIQSFETYKIFIHETTRYNGYIIIWESATYGQIIDLVVDEESRGKGYAKELLDYSLNELKSSGIKMISLEVRVDNERAIHLYESAGFIRDHIIKGYYKGIDGYFYIKGV